MHTWQLAGLVQAVLLDGAHGVGDGDCGHGRVVQRLECHGGVRAVPPHQVRRYVCWHRQRHRTCADLQRNIA